MRIRLFLLQVSSLTTLALVATAGHAQVSPDAASVTPADQLGEIIVTAQKRAVSLQRTPVSVEVFDAAALKANGITNIQDLSAYSPSVNFASNGPRAIVNVRGIASADVDETGEPAVAVSIDGAYIQRPVGLLAAFFDLDRVEVLRGPQGTLFGRNATGGAVNIITAKPTFELGGSASVEYGNFDTLRTTGVLNVPVSDTLALRASFMTNNHDGYQHNGPAVAQNADDDDTKAARLSALWKPTDRLTARVTGEYSDRGGVGPAFYGIPVQADASGVIDITPHLNSSVRDNPLNTQNRISTKIKSVRWNFEYDLGGATLTYIGGYADTRFRSLWDLDGTDINNYAFRVNEHIKTLNNEVRLASPDTDRFKWQAGAFFYNERQSLDNQFVDDKPTPVDLFIYDLGVKSRSYAFFGQASYELIEGLSVSGGARYSHDNKREFGTQTNASLGTYLTTGEVIYGAPTDRGGESSSSKVTWHAGLDYQLDPHHLLYAKIDTGYKAGGFSDLGQYKPETVTAYEIGAKNRFLDNRLQLNIDAYYEDYSNQQVTQFIAALGTLTTNAGKSRLYGVESELSYLLTPNDELDVSINYQSAKYRDFATAINDVNVQLRGNHLPQTPTWAFSGSFEHSWDVMNGQVTARVQSTYKSGQYFTFLNNNSDHEGGYTKTDLSVGYTPAKKNWEVTAYVRNLENSLVWTFSDVSGFFGSYRYEFSAPRTYGVRASINF